MTQEESAQPGHKLLLSGQADRHALMVEREPLRLSPSPNPYRFQPPRATPGLAALKRSP
jgi:hypothetical protein